MTTAERQARWRARHKLRQQGLEEVKNLWAKPAHHEPIRAYAEKLKDEDDGQTNDTDSTGGCVMIQRADVFTIDAEEVRKVLEAWQKVKPSIPEGCDPAHTQMIDNALWRLRAITQECA